MYDVSINGWAYHKDGVVRTWEYYHSRLGSLGTLMFQDRVYDPTEWPPYDGSVHWEEEKLPAVGMAHRA